VSPEALSFSRSTSPFPPIAPYLHLQKTITMSSSFVNVPYTNYFYGTSPVHSAWDMDTTDDFSVAMLDMANGDFRDDYENSFPPRDFTWWYFLTLDADARIYDSEVSSPQSMESIDL
jgi:hypothetical protein